MGQPKLRRADQPLWLQVPAFLIDQAASLKLAVLLILSFAVVLGLATFVESRYSMPASQFGVYATWWFDLLGFLLAVNIFSAAAVRYPWKRHQTGFVITHVGLLTLLAGCWLQRRGGVDAQMPIFEGQTSHLAEKDSQYLELQVRDLASGLAAEQAVHRVPFRGGPFNWSMYGGYRPEILPDDTPEFLRDRPQVLPILPWSLAIRDAGTVFDRDGVKLEVLNYCAEAEEIVLPRIRIGLSQPRRDVIGRDGKPAKSDYQFDYFEISVRSDWPDHQQRAFSTRQTVGGGKISFGMTKSPGETAHFRDSQPEGPVDAGGQIVLHAAGERFVLPVAAGLEAGQPQPLGQTGLSAQVLDADPAQPKVTLEIQGGDRPPSRLVLYADAHEFNLQDDDRGVYGTYWADQGNLSTQDKLRGRGKSRLDIQQGADLKLYYRCWNGHEVIARGPLVLERPADAFKMPIDQLQIKLAEHLVWHEPIRTVRPLPLDVSRSEKQMRNAWPRGSTRAAYVRLQAGEQVQQGWVTGPPSLLFPENDSAFDLPPPGQLDPQWQRGWLSGIRERTNQLARRQFQLGGRQVAVRLPLDQEVLNFRTVLREFEHTRDPGTNQDRTFSSYVQFLALESDEPLSPDRLKITMNAPIDWVDPVSGRTYRLFQESYQGPYRPGDGTFVWEQFYQVFPEVPRRPSLAMTVLTVNYDPGRGVKYLGSALVVLGIGVMFYMRAYFFQPQRRQKPAAERPAEKAVRLAGRQLAGRS